MITDEMVEAAARALYAAEKARRVKIRSIFDEVAATEVIEPYEIGADDKWRPAALAALLAAEAARKPDVVPGLERALQLVGAIAGHNHTDDTSWIVGFEMAQKTAWRVIKSAIIQDEPVDERKTVTIPFLPPLKLSRPINAPVEACQIISLAREPAPPSPSPEHPVDDDALVRRLDGLPQP